MGLFWETGSEMTAEAVQPLVEAIRRLQNSSRFSVKPSGVEILNTALSAAESAANLCAFLDEFLDKWTKKALVVEMREASCELEDALDSLVSDQFHSQSETEDELISLDLQGVREDVDVFTPKMNKLQRVFNPWLVEESDVLPGFPVSRNRFMSWYATKAASVFLGTKEDYIQDLQNLLPEEDDDFGFLLSNDIIGNQLEFPHYVIQRRLSRWWTDTAASFFMADCIQELPKQDVDFVSSNMVGLATDFVSSNMVGLAALFCKIRDGLIDDESKAVVYPIIGMAGIGKTAVAKKILQDPLISSKFECRIFVMVGPEYDWEEIVRAIAAQLDPDADEMLKREIEDLEDYLRKIFEVKKSLIVLDDVWHRRIFPDLNTIIKRRNSVSKILLTSRRTTVGNTCETMVYKVPFLNEEESWDLLRGKIFGEERCPHELEKAGKKIAKNCEGLPLLILTVASLLSKAEKTLEHWIEVAANKTNSIFVDAYEQITEVLYPSYDFLDQNQKTFFLYMAAFPQNCDVRLSKFITLWSVEGFLGSTSYENLQNHVGFSFKKLVSDNVALCIQESSTNRTYKPKVCSLHSVFWYLSKKEARNEKFLHVLNSYTDASVQGIESQRRLSIYKNILFSIKDVRDSIASISAVRSFLCTGPYHQYQVPICLDLRLLKILDALTIRFYEFPPDVLKLIHLKYLSLTCNGNLPPSISELWNLQCLILGQHLIIKSSMSRSYLPVEIWELQELEYLQIMGRNLPDPPPGAVLRNLMILLDVGAYTCTMRVVNSIPNLRKLRVHDIESSEFDASLPSSFYDDISHLKELRSLQYLVVLPNLMPVAAAPAPSLCVSCLIKLTLSGCGYSWKDMSRIAELPSLRVLKLKYYAFRGEKWRVEEWEFPCLTYLSIEDTDLVQWTGGNGILPDLDILSIKNCYKLQEIPKISTLTEVRLVDCNPSAVSFARTMASDRCCVSVHSSWLDDKRSNP